MGSASSSVGPPLVSSAAALATAAADADASAPNHTQHQTTTPHTNNTNTANAARRASLSRRRASFSSNSRNGMAASVTPLTPSGRVHPPTQTPHWTPTHPHTPTNNKLSSVDTPPKTPSSVFLPSIDVPSSARPLSASRRMLQVHHQSSAITSIPTASGIETPNRHTIPTSTTTPPHTTSSNLGRPAFTPCRPPSASSGGRPTSARLRTAIQSTPSPYTTPGLLFAPGVSDPLPPPSLTSPSQHTPTPSHALSEATRVDSLTAHTNNNIQQTLQPQQQQQQHHHSPHPLQSHHPSHPTLVSAYYPNAHLYSGATSPASSRSPEPHRIGHLHSGALSPRSSLSPDPRAHHPHYYCPHSGCASPTPLDGSLSPDPMLMSGYSTHVPTLLSGDEIAADHPALASFGRQQTSAMQVEEDMENIMDRSVPYCNLEAMEIPTQIHTKGRIRKTLSMATSPEPNAVSTPHHVLTRSVGGVMGVDALGVGVTSPLSRSSSTSTSMCVDRIGVVTSPFSCSDGGSTFSGYSSPINQAATPTNTLPPIHTARQNHQLRASPLPTHTAASAQAQQQYMPPSESAAHIANVAALTLPADVALPIVQSVMYDDKLDDYQAYKSAWFADKESFARDQLRQSNIDRAVQQGLLPRHHARKSSRSMFEQNNSNHATRSGATSPCYCGGGSGATSPILQDHAHINSLSPLGTPRSPTIFGFMLESSSRTASRNISPLPASPLSPSNSVGGGVGVGFTLSVLPAHRHHASIGGPHDATAAAGNASGVGANMQPKVDTYDSLRLGWIPSDLALTGAIPVPYK